MVATMNYNDRLNYGVVRMLDIEVYQNLFVICLDNPNQIFFSPQELLRHLRQTYSTENPCTLVTYNGLSYDFPMMQEAYKYFMRPIEDDETRLAVWRTMKEFSDKIINEEKVFLERLGLPDGVRHIDVKAVCPVMTSLKLLGARLGCESIQDLPYRHDALLTQEQQVNVIKYCLHDLEITRMVWNDRRGAIDLREWHQKNLSDAQMAEKTLVPQRRPGKNSIPVKVNVFGYDFQINPGNGSPIDPGLPDQVIDGVTYQVGLGGLHSADRPSVIDLRGNDDYMMVGVDVASYYPSMLLGPLTGVLDPDQEKEYRQIRVSRIASKHRAKELSELGKQRALSESEEAEYRHHDQSDKTNKIVLNGSFGKLGSKYSPLYNPKAMLSVTLLGQVQLLQLIRNLVASNSGIKVLSANTDGVEVILPKQSIETFRQVCKAWEATTTTELEEEQVSFVLRRDVNNYAMLTTKGKVKTKGVFEPASIRKSMNFDIINEAVMASFGICRSGQCTPEDIRMFITKLSQDPTEFQKFLAVRTVNGGGILRPTYETRDDWELIEPKKWIAKSTGKKQTRVSRPAPYEVFMGGTPVGRVIRWYIGVTGENVYTPKGGKVALTDNAVLVQNLSERPTTPIDLEWYIGRAEALRAALLNGSSVKDEECQE